MNEKKDSNDRRQKPTVKQASQILRTMSNLLTMKKPWRVSKALEVSDKVKKKASRTANRGAIRVRRATELTAPPPFDGRSQRHVKKR
ncbi:hypothetical protein Y032_0138g2065 [Ancylostoma ceylanicum]|uniref:Uncharacterized protein n=1 Tax=Ancylostoma ceylanicum TaxID=53326 RepID=A0A016T4Z1_9BILA|nr:hypothetical protein Y032_0138g2065 [Ancylostoma ceylanicum]